MPSPIYSLSLLVSQFDRLAVNVTRLSLAIVTIWIGSLKLFRYEAEGIVPFVANSPFFSWMLDDPEHYSEYKIPEGASDSVAQAWHHANNTYPVAWLIGGVIVVIGLLIVAGWVWPSFGVVGSLLLVGMSVVTLSFLVTTPEAWVPDHGSGHYGFPLLAAPGRLVVKDLIMLGAALWTATDSAKRVITQKRAPSEPVTPNNI